MTTQTQPDRLDAIVDDLAKELVPLVAKIEGDELKTTQNNYGRYMSVIAQLAKSNKQVGQIVVLALLKAGANKQGVSDAYKLSF